LSDDAKDPFLSRWSRRKVAARRGEALREPPAVPGPAAPAPAAPAAAEAGAPAESPLELPSLDTLKGLESDYKAFMRPDVDPATRSAALKKLFGDPHFNAMDGLDVYIDDYSIPDPIPAAMLKTLSAVRTLGLLDGEEEKEKAATAVDAEAARQGLPATAETPIASAPQPQVETPEPADVPRKPDAA
jgi:hypothetical protein